MSFWPSRNQPSSKPYCSGLLVGMCHQCKRAALSWRVSEVFNHRTAEAIAMCWLKRDIWRIGIPLASLLLLLMLMVLVSLSAGAYEATSGLAVSGSVQATPTVDVTATMTALNEEKLRQEIQQLKNQNNWLANNSTALIAAVATVIVALFG